MKESAAVGSGEEARSASEGFPASWLALREPADAAACCRPILDRLGAWARARPAVRVVDLGAGTGAHLRRTAPALGPRQSWTLVERDPALLAAGADRLADATVPWRYRELDLARDLAALEDEACELVTASALLDLVSRAWLERLVAWRARAGAALLAVLSFDGRVRWHPIEPGDGPCTALVNRHQRRDKGFGPALGPDATRVLQELLDDAPGELLVGRSDWRLGPEAAALQEELLEGHARAAAEIAPGRARAVERWRRRRRAHLAAGTSRVLVGHLDLLFLPEPG